MTIDNLVTIGGCILFGGFINIFLYAIVSSFTEGFIRLPFTPKITEEEKKYGYKIAFRERFIYDGHNGYNGVISDPSSWFIEYLAVRPTRHGWAYSGNTNLARIFINLCFFIIPAPILNCFYSYRYGISRDDCDTYETCYLKLSKEEFPSIDDLYKIYPERLINVCKVDFNNALIEYNEKEIIHDRKELARKTYTDKLRNTKSDTYLVDYDAYNPIEPEALTKSVLTGG